MTNMAAAIMSRAVANGKLGRTYASLQRSEMIDATHALALFKVGGDVHRHSDIEVAVAASYDNKVRVLSGSAMRPDPNSPELVQCVVQLNRPTKPYAEQASLQGMTAVSANIFRDENDDIWTKMGEDEKAVLVKKTQDNLDEILSARSALSMTTASVGVSMHEKFSVGDIIGVYDINQERMRFGIAIDTAGAMVESDESGKHTGLLFNPKQVVAAGLGQRAFLPEEVAQLAPASFNKGNPLSRENMVNKMLDYYAVLYNRNGDYYKKLVALMRNAFGTIAVPSA